MAKHGVVMPIVGKVYVEVEADNEEDAITASQKSVNRCFPCVSLR